MNKAEAKYIAAVLGASLLMGAILFFDRFVITLLEWLIR
jgi:hypothetical protein